MASVAPGASCLFLSNLQESTPVSRHFQSISSCMFRISNLQSIVWWHLARRHPLGSQSRRLLLLVILVMFIVHTCLMAEVSICFLDDIKGIFQAVNGRINLQAQIAEAVLARINVRIQYFCGIHIAQRRWWQYFLSDVVVVWRAWSLPQRRSSLKYSRYILGVCLLASFG